MYTLIYLANRSNKWAFQDEEDRMYRRQKIREFKKVASAKIMCEKHSKPLRNIMEYIMCLKYEEEPEYDKIIHMFVCALLERSTPP